MRPCHELMLEVGVPDLANIYFILDYDKLDSNQWLGPDPLPSSNPGAKAFTLDASLLDSTVDLIELAGGGGLPPGFTWLSMTSKTMNISIDRGMDVRQGIVARPTAGTLTAQVIDPFYDALANQYIGLKSIIRLRAGTEPIFVGEIIRLETSYTPDGVPQVDVQAADGIARLNSVLVPARPAETFGERVNAVAQLADLTVTTATGLAQTATDEARTALETLYLAQDTEAGWAMIDRYNHLTTWERGVAETLTAEVFLFSDNHKEPGHSACITGIQTGISTDQVINNLQVRNIEWDDSDPDPTRHRWVTVNYDYASARSTSFYGVARKSVTTSMDPALFTTYQTWVFDKYDEPHRKVAAIEYRTDDLTTPAIPPVALIDVGDVVRIRMNAPATGTNAIDRVERVTRINHTINPAGWTTQLALM